MTIGFRSIGAGPEKIIALHGWLSDHQVYAPILEFFDEARYTVVLADYRGYGLSRALVNDYSVEQMASDVIDLAATLGWSRCHLIGHSMSGMVIQKVASLAPDLVTSGIAITPVPACGHALDDATTAYFRSAADDDKALAEIFDILTGQRHGKTFLATMVRKARASMRKESFHGYLATWTQTDISGEVTGLTAPFLVITGAHDGALGLAVVQEPLQKQIPNVRFETIASAGHYPLIETPVETVALIDRFLMSITGS